MRMLVICGLVALAGGFGGVISAVLSEDRGFALPRPVCVDGVGVVWRPGFVGHVLVGAGAAFVSWGLNGPMATEVVYGGSLGDDSRLGLTLAALAGAVGVGVGGAKWLASYIDKQLLQGAASVAAAKVASPESAMKIAHATPAAAVAFADQMQASR